MSLSKLSQTINKPVGEVFDTVVHVENFPSWNPTTKSARRLDSGPIGNGTRFELEIKGFGKTIQELQEFQANRQVRLVPHIKVMGGGHRFVFTDQGTATRIDHELEMIPKGIFKLFGPFMGMIGKKNLQKTAAALQKYLES